MNNSTKTVDSPVSDVRMSTSIEDSNPKSALINGADKAHYKAVHDTGAEDNKGPDVDMDIEENLFAKTSERDLSNFRAFVHLFRVMTGPSVLGTAKIMYNGGVVLGPIGFVILGYLNALCNITIVKCNRVLCKRLGRVSLTYDDVVEECVLLHSRSPRYISVAHGLKRCALTCLVLSQIGLLSVYINVIGTIIREEIRNAVSNADPSLVLIELIVSLLLIPYGWLRNLKMLSWFSVAANVIILVCMLTILQWSCRNLHDPGRLPLVTTDPWTVPLLLGATIFTVEGIPMIIPIENRVQKPQDFGGQCGLVMLAAGSNVFLNIAVGFFSYVAIGQDVHGNVILDLPAEGVYAVLNVAMAMCLFLTYTIQMFLPAEVMCASIKSRFTSDFIQSYGNMLARTVVVLISFGIGAAVPRVDLLMSLVGACATTVLIFGFPPLAEMLVEHKENGGHIPLRILIKDISLMILGLVCFLTGTYTSIHDIVAAI